MMYLACPRCCNQVSVYHAWDFQEIHVCNSCGCAARLQYAESRDEQDEYQCWWLEVFEIPWPIMEKLK